MRSNAGPLTPASCLAGRRAGAAAPAHVAAQMRALCYIARMLSPARPFHAP